MTHRRVLAHRLSSYLPLTLLPCDLVNANSVEMARYVLERGTLEFIDKNRQRCEQLGRRTMEVPVADLAKLSQVYKDGTQK